MSTKYIHKKHKYIIHIYIIHIHNTYIINTYTALMGNASKECKMQCKQRLQNAMQAKIAKCNASKECKMQRKQRYLNI